MSQSSPMNGGAGTYSYTKNSTLQRDGASAMKDAIKEAVMENLDIEKLVCGSTRFAIADLGCSVGPNTFYAMESLIQTVKHKCHQQGLDSDKLEFQVFFNDQMGNDFNTLFASLPQCQLGRNYFAAAVPGSFHGRLFPSSSVHVAYCLFAIHWLSKPPEELLVKDSPAWNAGKIFYSGSSDAVVKAYADQFERDMVIFLGARAQEIVGDGMIVIVVPGIPDGVVDSGLFFGFLESLLAEMVRQELIEQEQVDLFNIPNVYPSTKDLRRAVERNGCFEIVKMEFKHVGGTMEPESYMLQMRAIFERSMVNHFGNAVVHQLFERAMQLNLDFARLLRSARFHEIMGQVLAVLKRK